MLRIPTDPSIEVFTRSEKQASVYVQGHIDAIIKTRQDPISTISRRYAKTIWTEWNPR